MYKIFTRDINQKSCSRITILSLKMFKTFSWFDYFLFVFMLILSALIGIYYGFFKQQKTATDYLMGGKNMKVWPVAMSMVTRYWTISFMDECL